MGRLPKILIAVAMVAVIGLALYYNIQQWHSNRVTKAVQQEQRIWQEKNEILAEQIERLEGELAEARGEVQNEERISEALGVQPPVDKKPDQPDQPPVQDLDARIAAFFAYLDQQPYIRDFQLEGGTYSQYRQALEKLSQNPPVIAGETDILYRLLKNIAHFYRVIGRQDVRLVKDVLANEEEILETVMQTYYRWLISSSETQMARPSDETLYTYSAYFLHTIGGRSYLLRRDSLVRTLTQYYCVLLLDQANDRKLNSYGIDIRPYIRSSLEDIRYLLGLAYRDHYIQTLKALQEKYEMAAVTR